MRNIKKGLEFDDVILYNFFTDSELKEDTWNILTLLDICDEKLSEEDFKFQYDCIIYFFLTKFLKLFFSITKRPRF